MTSELDSDTDTDAMRLRELDASIARSLEDLRAGRLTEANEACSQLEAKYRRMAAERTNQRRSD